MRRTESHWPKRSRGVDSWSWPNAFVRWPSARIGASLASRLDAGSPVEIEGRHCLDPRGSHTTPSHAGGEMVRDPRGALGPLSLQPGRLRWARQTLGLRSARPASLHVDG